jgi:hypothetical protein
MNPREPFIFFAEARLYIHPPPWETVSQLETDCRLTIKIFMGNPY